LALTQVDGGSSVERGSSMQHPLLARKENGMGERARAAGRARAAKGKAGQAARGPAKTAVAQPRTAEEPVEWLEQEDGAERLEEGEMEILLTGHAATHGIEGDDNWMLEPTRHDLD